MTESITELVKEDSDLTPAEKETSINFTKTEDRARVFTAEAGLMRRLLQHSEFQVGHVVTESRARVESVAELDATNTAIVGVKGTIPVGALKIQRTARASSGHASVISYTGGGEA